MRLLERLPDEERYETDAYGLLWDAAGQQACSWEVWGGELERRVAFDAAREVESVGAAHKGMRKERGYAGESACFGLLRQAQT